MVSFSTVRGRFDNTIQNWYDLEWTELVDLMHSQGHIKTENKDVLLISPWKYKTTDDNFKPALTSDGDPLLIDDKPVVGRLADNVIGTNMLMFDFDGTISVSHAKALFRPYTHIGYTSYSHMSSAKMNADCFRIVVPLAQLISAEEIVKRRKAIYAAFAGIDTSCLSLARSFYVASTAPERQHLAHMWFNEGELLDAFDYDAETYIPPLHSPAIVRDADHDKILSALKNVHLGHEPEWFSVAVAMASNGFTYEQFCDVSIGHLMHSKDIKDCEKKWKGALKRVGNGYTTSVGYLINLCKKHGTWSKDTEPKLPSWAVGKAMSPADLERVKHLTKQLNELKGAQQ